MDVNEISHDQICEAQHQPDDYEIGIASLALQDYEAQQCSQRNEEDLTSDSVELYACEIAVE